MATPHDKPFNHMPDECSGSVGGYSAAQIEAMRPMMPQAPAPQFQPVMPQAPKQPAPVDKAMANLGSNLVDLERALENLVERIVPALTPLTPQAPTAGSPKAPRPASSGLTQAIEDKADRAAMLVETIESITARVEL